MHVGEQQIADDYDIAVFYGPSPNSTSNESTTVYWKGDEVVAVYKRQVAVVEWRHQGSWQPATTIYHYRGEPYSVL